MPLLLLEFGSLSKIPTRSCDTTASTSVIRAHTSGRVEEADINIEHVAVDDDPREWSTARKTVTLLIISAGSLLAGLGAIIYNPAIHDIQLDLNATNAEISLSISLFALLQGTMPFVWSATSEVKGRKVVYICSIFLYAIGSICIATARSIAEVIGMRCLQAAGSSAVITIGAATLADIYNPHERGTMMGIYYTGPLLGPSLGLIIGGGLTQALSWKAPFWALTIISGLVLVSFLLFFKDTFRRERSLAYQDILKQRTPRNGESAIADAPDQTLTDAGDRNNLTEKPSGKAEEPYHPSSISVVAEASPSLLPTLPKDGIKLWITDVNLFRPIWLVLRRWNNFATLIASAILFAFTYCVAYTASRTLASAYGYDALNIGLVLLSYGGGSIVGSILGGRWSDRVLGRLKSSSGGCSYPEMRLQSTKPAMTLLPASITAYGWFAEKHFHVASICVALFFVGLSCTWIYSSTIAYIVDANAGRSSTAVACNSLFRGVLAFIATEVAVPLSDAIGEGGLYTIWAGLAIVTELLILLVAWKGSQWRERSEASERAAAGRALCGIYVYQSC